MKTRLNLIAALIVVCLIVTSVTAENWPCFRGPTRQGISTEKGIPVEWDAETNIKWKTPITGEGFSSPVVYGDSVYITTATDGGTSYRLICFDRTYGTVKWNKQLTVQEAGHKQKMNSYASSTPVTDGTRIITIVADGTIIAVNMQGNRIWSHKEFDYYSEHGIGVSPVMHEDLVIVSYDYSSDGEDKKVGWQKPWDKSFILALDKKTGDVKWKAFRGMSRIAHVTSQVMKVDGSLQLISGAGDVVQGFDLEKGKLLWTATSLGEAAVPSIVVGQGLVFTASGFGDSAIRAVRAGGRGDVTKTHIAWEDTKDVPHIPSMLYSKGLLYVINETGIARCLKASDGSEVWRQRFGGRYSASPVWIEGRIYYLSEKGKASVIAEGPEFKILAENELDGKFCASPAISQGNIFLRSDDNVFCIGK